MPAYVRYLTIVAAVAVVLSNGGYLVYIQSHPLLRGWAGANSLLLGVFLLLLGYGQWLRSRRWRWPILFGVVALLNFGAGVAYLF